MMEEIDLSEKSFKVDDAHLSSQLSMDEEAPDPRIQVELERLNTATDLINKLEVDLDEGRMRFRQMLNESTQSIDALTKKLGKCIEQARPYYDARISSKNSLNDAQKSAIRYERAVSQHSAAREMVQLAEEGLLTRGCIFDSTWQEMLNHATTKVNDAEKEKMESANEHKHKSIKYHDDEEKVKALQKELKKAIAKSSLNARRRLLQLNNLVDMHQLQLLPYFEMKAAFNQRLEEQKRQIRDLERAVTASKESYAQALQNLETISEQIHQNRQERHLRKLNPLPPADFCMQLPRNDNGTSKGSDASKTSFNHSSLNGTRVSPDSSEIDGKMASSSNWHFVPYNGTSASSSNFLSLGDRDSLASDSESLPSMEMLSDEVISNLMLDPEQDKLSEDEFLQLPSIDKDKVNSSHSETSQSNNGTNSSSSVDI